MTGRITVNSKLYASDYAYQGTAWQKLEQTNYGPGGEVIFYQGNNNAAPHSTTPNNILYNNIINQWTFMFSYLDVSDDKFKIGVVMFDGTLIIGGTYPAAGIYACTPSESHTYFYAFRAFGDGAWRQFIGQIGDIIVYNSSGCKGSGILTLAEVAQWYDYRRSRYGMAARSGW